MVRTLSLLLLASTLACVKPGIAVALDPRIPLCNDNTCSPPQFCCGNFCCQETDTCGTNGRCARRPLSAPATRPGHINVRRVGPDNCIHHPDGAVTCPPTQPPQRYSISGDHFSFGKVRVGIYKADGSAVWQQVVQSVAGGAAGLSTISVDTNVIACDYNPHGVGVSAAWAKATDLRSGFVSNQVQVYVGCL